MGLWNQLQRKCSNFMYRNYKITDPRIIKALMAAIPNSKTETNASHNAALYIGKILLPFTNRIIAIHG